MRERLGVGACGACGLGRRGRARGDAAEARTSEVNVIPSVTLSTEGMSRGKDLWMFWAIATWAVVALSFQRM